jgi:hypothetical protein
MNKKSLAEALYLFNRLENLMRQNGAKGESFSDLVKSYDKYQDDKKLKPCQDFTKKVGHKYYWNRSDGKYYLKDSYRDDDDDIWLDDEDPFVEEVNLHTEEKRYRDCKEKIRAYYEHRDNLMDGFYNNLRIIGHERNQLLHIHNYEIENFSRFKKACIQAIDYLQSGRKPRWGKIISLKEPPETIQSASRHIGDEISNSFWFMLRFAGFTILFYFLMQRFGWCQECSEVNRYIMSAGFGVFGAWMLFPLLIGVVAGIVLYLLENIFYLLVGAAFIWFIFSGNSHKKKEENTPAVKVTCQYRYVTASSLNIRKNPLKFARKSGQLKRNDKVCITKRRSGWAYIDGRGWVLDMYLSSRPYREVKSKESTSEKSNRSEKAQKSVEKKRSVQKKKVKRKPKKAVYHCTAKAKRASGWVEKLGQKNARRGALHQCEIRRVTEVPCRITECYRVR